MRGLSKNGHIYMARWPAHGKIAKQIPKSLLSIVHSWRSSQKTHS